MTAVLEGFRDRGVGRQLKLFQRQDALRRGIELIEWTFDPLEMRNAHFNLMRLGAVARRYIPDYYGVTESPLHGGLPTDRLVAEWWVASERVRGMAVGGRYCAGVGHSGADQGSPWGREVRMSLPEVFRRSNRAMAPPLGLAVRDSQAIQGGRGFREGYAAVRA